MRTYLTAPTLIRFLSLLLVPALCLLFCWPGGQPDALSAGTAFLCGAVPLLFLPLSYEDPGASSVAAVLAFAVLLSAAVMSPEGRNGVLIRGLVLCGVYFCYRSVAKFSQLQALFRNDAVWCAVEDYARLIYLLVFVLLAGVLLHAGVSAPPWLSWILSAAAAALFLLLYLRAWTGRTMFLRRRKEEQLRSIIRDSRLVPPSEPGEDGQMYEVYAKAVRHMETEKPFLEESFSLRDLALAVFSNKLYLSRAINAYSGRNFRQFVNYYRVQYSIELMKKDRKLRVIQLALMSGFHSVVTYNMAFKLNMNMTPSEYIHMLPLREEAAAARSREAARSAQFPDG